MIALICLFFPAILSVWIYEKLAKHTLVKRNWLYLYALNVVLINAACFLVKKVVLHTADSPFGSFSADLTPTAALNYLVMSLPAGGVLAFVEVLLGKYVKVTVEDEHDKD